MKIDIKINGLNLDIKIRKRVGFRYEYTRKNVDFGDKDRLLLFLNKYLKEMMI